MSERGKPGPRRPSSTPKAGTPKAGTPKAGTPKAGTPKAGTPRPGARGPATPKLTPKAKKAAAAVQKEFGKAVRRAAERSGRKPQVWQQAERAEARELVLNRIGSSAVQRATTRTWPEWLTTLDAEGMQGKPHRDVVHHLATTHGLSSWWAQMVCVGYEQAKGQRVPNEKARGFEVSVTRTLEASASEVFRAFNDPTRRGWCHVQDYVVRTTIAPRSLRLGFSDGTLVAVAIERKGNTRCAVSVQHAGLADEAAAERARAEWKESLARLAQALAE